MPRNKETFYVYAVYAEFFAALQQHLFIVYSYLRQLIHMVYYLTTHFAGKVAVFGFANVQRGVFKKTRAVRFDCANMVRILMGYEYMANAGGVYAQPFHLFLQPIVIITGIYHNSGVPFTIKEYVCHPFAHACRIFVYPACVERLEYLLAAVHAAHFLLLELRCLF